MTEANAEPSPLEPPSETFAGVTLRRVRYLVAVALSAALILWVGWALVCPPANSDGLSLLWWGPNFLGAAVLVALMVAAVAVSTLVCHPDAPYAGVWCAFLGLGGLAIRGGTIRFLLVRAQTEGGVEQVRTLYHTLAAECLLWAVVIVAAEVTARFVWPRFFANTRWLAYVGAQSQDLHKKVGGSAGVLTFEALYISGKYLPKNRWVQNLGALVMTAAAGCLLLPFLMQSQEKGQVLFASFVALGVGAWMARLLAPEAWPVAIWLGVPLAAAVGYMMASGEWRYPGMALSPMGRALPIDYVSGGMAGAILGYYTGMRMQVNKAMEELEGAGRG